MECVPNFSEGRDKAVIDAIAASIQQVPDVSLLHIDISPAANRTVMTFAGRPEAVVEAAFQAIKMAGERIDMSKQEGVHPRIGATDVCPLVPLANMTMEEAVAYSEKLGKRVGKELNIPVYLYEYSAKADHRRALPDIRKGQYEGFAEKMKLPEWLPDYGPAVFAPNTGATVLGARDILVAFNISLNTQDVEKAEYIAVRLRERGYWLKQNGQKTKVPGLLPKLRAIGWYMADFGSAQVSMNLLDYRLTSPLKVWETCKTVAKEINVELIGSELIGLMPEACLLEAGNFVLQGTAADKKEIIQKGIEHLGLDKVKPFTAEEKVLEYALQIAGWIQ